METPDGVKYLLWTQDQSPVGRSVGVPRREPVCELPDPSEGTGWFRTPTTRVVVWMFRRPNRIWALPIALLLVPGYLVAAGLVQSYLVPLDGIYLLVAWLCVYNGAKFAVTGPIAFLMHLVDRARGRRRQQGHVTQHMLYG